MIAAVFGLSAQVIGGCQVCGQTSQPVTLIDMRRDVSWRLCEDCTTQLVTALHRPVTPCRRGGGKVGRSHPDTSKVAATRVRAGTQQAELLRLVVDAGRDGLTCAEAALLLSDAVGHTVSRNQTATRMGELAERLLVTVLRHKSGIAYERATSDGATGRVWVCTDRGLTEHARLFPC